MHNMDADMLDTLSTDYDLPLDPEHVPVHHPSGLAWLQTSWLKRRGERCRGEAAFDQGKKGGRIYSLGSCTSLAASCISAWLGLSEGRLSPISLELIGVEIASPWA